MAIVFPASPSVNDTFTEGSITYKWDGAKWIGLGVTPADRLVEGSNSLEINAANNLIWTGNNVGIGTNAPLQTGSGRTVLNINGTNNALLNFSYGGTLSGFIYGANDEFRMEADGTNPLVFRTAGGTALTIDTNAKLILPTGSPGIQFGSTDSGGSVTSQTLDDYEEGSWTPTLVFGSGSTGIVYAMREGYYTKIGRQVIAQFRIELTNKGSSTGGMTITTPFAVDDQFSSTGIDGNTLVAYTSGMSSSQVGNSHVSGYCEGGTSISYFTARLSTGNAATLNNGDVENNFSISGTMLFYNA